MAKLIDFMISRVRVKMYKIFFGNAQDMFYVRQLTRMTGEEINAVRRELQRMHKRGLITKEKRGNRLYYAVNPKYDFYDDLISMIAKSTGLGLAMRENKAKLGKIKYIMFSGRFARKQQRVGNDVDVLVVGEIVMPELNAIIQKEESVRKSEINYTVMTTEEFEFRKNRRDPFLTQILGKSRVMIIGDQIPMLDRTAEE